jgi:hypothetical protein
MWESWGVKQNDEGAKTEVEFMRTASSTINRSPEHFK